MKGLYICNWVIHSWWRAEASVEYVIAHLLNHWYLLCAYYVQRAWTLQDNRLEVNQRILSIRHWPCIGPPGWRIILKRSQLRCRSTACNVLHTMHRAIWGFNLPALYSPSTTRNNSSGVRFLWLGGFWSDLWASDTVGTHPLPLFSQTPHNRLPYNMSNLQYNEFVLF